MTTAEQTRKKSVFVASSRADVAEVQKAMETLNLHAVTLDQAATPGTSWVESLHRCIQDADIVIGIMGDRRKDTNVLFELGVASALNKPVFLFLTPDFPIELVPPSGIPYLRMDLRNEDSVMFGLQQVLSLSRRGRSHQRREGQIDLAKGLQAPCFGWSLLLSAAIGSPLQQRWRTLSSKQPG